MATTTCSTCNNELSFHNRTCTNCGTTQKTTATKTSRRMKPEALCAWGLFFLGIIVWAGGLDSINPKTSVPEIGIGMSLIGAVWLIVGKLRSWWHSSANVFFDFADDVILK